MSKPIYTVDVIGDEALTTRIIERSITEIVDDKIPRVRTRALQQCTNLTSVNFLAVTSIGKYAFSNCKNLISADFSALTSIADDAFYYAEKLSAVILRNTSQVATLGSYVFTNTGITLGAKKGYIYVPAALLDSYKSATNWSNIAAQIRALEDYTVDGTTTGALDPTKI